MSRAKRAKRSKIPKILFMLSLLACMIYCLLSYNLEIKDGIAKVTNIIGGTDVKTYFTNDSVNDYVKAIFTDNDGIRYIPIVYENYNKQITASDIREKFAEYGIELTYVPNNIINGSIVKTEKAEYKVLIYGDVNSDGKVNVLDAQRIVWHVVRKGSYTLNGMNAIAADIQNDEDKAINVRDAKRIVDFVLSRNPIVAKIPASDISKDTEAPVITLNGDETVIIVKGDKYIEQGASVSDDTDPNVKVTYTYPEEIDTNIVRDYRVIYTATDISGKTTEKVRTVSVQEENIPEIIFNDLDDKIFVNIADRNDASDAADAIEYFNSLDLSAYAVDKQDGRLSGTVTMTEFDIENLYTPGEYTITYTSPKNSQGKVGTKTRKIEVVDRIKHIYLHDLSGNNVYEFNEGDKIELDNLVADIYRVSGNDEIDDNAVPVKEFGKAGKYEDLVLNIKEEGEANNITDNIAVYKGQEGTSLNDNATANRLILATAIWTNPCQNEEYEKWNSCASAETEAGRMTVIGKIRQILDDEDESVDPVDEAGGIKATLLKVASITTKNYQQKLTEDNLEITATMIDRNGEEKVVDLGDKNSIKSVNARVDYTTKPGTAIVYFFANNEGIYNITLKAVNKNGGAATVQGDNIIKEIKDIKITSSDVVNLIIPSDYKLAGEADIPGTSLYDGVFKINGEAKKIGLTFRHNYGGITLPVAIQGSAGNDKIDGFSEAIKVKESDVSAELDVEDGTSLDIISENGYVKGIEITPPKTGTIPDKGYIENRVTIYVKRNTTKEISISHDFRVYPESVFSVAFDTDKINLYLTDKKEADNYTTYKDGDTIYTLVRANLQDQYTGKVDSELPKSPSTMKINAEMLMTSNEGLSKPGSVVIIDGATAKDGRNTYIKVAGFDKNGHKVQSGPIEYIGIALNPINGYEKLGDEDHKLEEEPIIKAYYAYGTEDNPKTETSDDLNIEAIIKRDISNITVTRTKESDYCYENSVVANVSSGAWEEDLKNTDKIDITVSGTDVTIPSDVKVEPAGPSFGAVTDLVSCDDGTIDVRLNAPYAGKYQIRARINDKEDITKDKIVITENPIITNVGFSYMEKTLNSSGDVVTRIRTTESYEKNGVIFVDYGGKETIPWYTNTTSGATKNGMVRQSKTERHTILYYHEYPNGEKRLISDLGLIPTSNNVTITDMTDYAALSTQNSECGRLAIVRTSDGKAIGEKDTIHLNGLEVRYSDDRLANKELTVNISVKQTKYGDDVPNFNYSVKIKTISSATKTSLSLQSLNNNSFNLYTYGIDGLTNGNTAYINGDAIYKTGGLNYTVFKICYIDEDFDEVPILASNISNKKKGLTGSETVWVLDNLYQSTYDLAMVKSVTLAKNGNKFTQETNDNVWYIGISAMKDPFTNAYSQNLWLYLNGMRVVNQPIKVFTSKPDVTDPETSTPIEPDTNVVTADNNTQIPDDLNVSDDMQTNVVQKDPSKTDQSQGNEEGNVQPEEPTTTQKPDNLAGNDDIQEDLGNKVDEDTGSDGKNPQKPQDDRRQNAEDE